MRYREGESLWLDDAELAGMAQVKQDVYSERDDWIGIIQEFLDKPITPDWEDKTPEERRAWVRGDSLEQWDELDLVPRETVSGVEIRVECFGDDRAGIKGNDFTGRRISRIMGQMPGWKKLEKLVKTKGYGPQRVYVRTGSEAHKRYEIAEEFRKYI